MKTCGRCKTSKPFADFGVDRSTSDGLKHTCRACRTEQSRQHYLGHRDDVLEASRLYAVADPERRLVYARRGTLKRFGLTPEDYVGILAVQDGRCALCSATTYHPRARHLGVDHDHACCPGTVSCGRCVRGLLCVACNGEIERVCAGLRMAAPDVAEYLANPPAQRWRAA